MTGTIGQQLHLARQERGITLEQAFQATHIRPHYLEAMEADNFARLPSKAQARGFLRAYASLLGLSPEPLLISLDGLSSASPALQAVPETAPVLRPEASSDKIGLAFTEIGEQLKQRRELLGLSIEEVERQTHLRGRYLQALEDGNLSGLPSPVQGRGMLLNYATFLGLDAEPVLLLYADGLQARFAERQATQPRPKVAGRVRQPSTPGPLRRILSNDFLLGGFLVLLLGGFVFWGALRISSLRQQAKPSITVPSIAEALQPTPTPILSITPPQSTEPGQAVPAESQPPVDLSLTTEVFETGQLGTEVPPQGGASVQVSFTARQRAWVRVTVDGEVEFVGRVLPGSAYTFAGEEQIELLSGNGAALQVFYNQTDLGALGDYGEVVHRIFTRTGMLVPTPTITPTPTATQPTTSTPQPTGTPQPSPAP